MTAIAENNQTEQELSPELSPDVVPDGETAVASDMAQKMAQDVSTTVLPNGTDALLQDTSAELQEAFAEEVLVRAYALLMINLLPVNLFALALEKSGQELLWDVFWNALSQVAPSFGHRTAASSSSASPSCSAARSSTTFSTDLGAASATWKDNSGRANVRSNSGCNITNIGSLSTALQRYITSYAADDGAQVKALASRFAPEFICLMPDGEFAAEINLLSAHLEMDMAQLRKNLEQDLLLAHEAIAFQGNIDFSLLHPSTDAKENEENRIELFYAVKACLSKVFTAAPFKHLALLSKLLLAQKYIEMMRRPNQDGKNSLSGNTSYSELEAQSMLEHVVAHVATHSEALKVLGTVNAFYLAKQRLPDKNSPDPVEQCLAHKLQQIKDMVRAEYKALRL